MNRLPSTESLPDAFLDLMDYEGESESELQPHEVDLRLLDFEDSSKQNEASGSAGNLSHQKSETLLPGGIVKMNTNDNGCCSDEDIIEFVKDGTEETEESPAKGGVHPLLFPDVIKDVMNHLPAKDIENCRLVCRSWNTEACKVLKTKRVVAFMDADAVRVYNTAMRSTMYFPHAQFEFCIQDFTGLVDEDLREFWNIFGTHIKSLELRQTHLFWRDFYEVVEQKLPNLEKLTLRHLPRHVLRSRNVPAEQHLIPSVKELRLASLPTSDFGQSGSNERLTTLLKALPNLEVIEFLPIKQATVQTKVSNVVVDILRKPEISLPHLKRVNLNLELNTEGLEALTMKHFPLQRLQITLSDGIKATSFKDLLMSLRPTLTELKIGFPDTFSNYQTFLGLNDSMKPEECVQILTNVKLLSMKNFKGSINFVHKLLGLRDLRFETTSDLAKSIPFGFKRKSYSFRQSEEHNLQSLQITSSTSLAETLTLDGISRCFPYLSCLRLHAVDDDGLGVIYRNLPFLSDVQLVDANCTDQGLTGIPLEICNDMVETCTFIVVQADRYRRDLFIGSLQFLRKFSITASKISDAAIALGLVDCKNLRELKIGSPLITDTGVIFITDKFCRQLDLLDVSNCSEITEQSKFYAGEKISGKLVVAESQEPTGKQIVVKPVELIDSDRAIVKTKRSCMPLAANANSKFLKPDIDFFEEHTDEEARDRGVGMFLAAPFPDNGNRQRIIRIREALRRNAEFMRTLQRLGIVQFRRLYRRELQEGFFRGRLLEGNLERLRRRELAIRHLEFEDVDEMLHQEFPFNGQDVPGVVEVGNVDIDVVVVEDDEEQEQHQEHQQLQQPGAMNLDEDDGGPQGGAEALPNRLPDFHIAEIFRLGLRLDDVEYWLRNRPLFERDEQGNNNANPGGARGWDIGINLNLAEEEANGGAAANPINEDEDIDLAAIRRAVMHAFGDEFEDAEPPFVALPRIN